MQAVIPLVKVLNLTWALSYGKCPRSLMAFYEISYWTIIQIQTCRPAQPFDNSSGLITEQQYREGHYTIGGDSMQESSIYTHSLPFQTQRVFHPDPQYGLKATHTKEKTLLSPMVLCLPPYYSEHSASSSREQGHQSYLIAIVTAKCSKTSFEPCHGKTCFKIFVVAIPNEGFPRQSFGQDTNYRNSRPGVLVAAWALTPIKLYSAAFTDDILQLVSNQRKDRRGPAHQVFVWYDIDKDLKARFPMTWLTCDKRTC